MARRTLTNEVKQGILDGLRNGTSPALLAGQFGVSIPTVYNYRKTLSTTVAAPVTTTPELNVNVEAPATAVRTGRTNTRRSC